jgi:hypothetical protein
VEPRATDQLAPPPEPAPAPAGGAPGWTWANLRQPAFVLGVVAAASAYVYAVDPNAHTTTPPCPLFALTGLDCPACGGTRAVHALLHGDVGQAFDHNVLALVLLPLAAYALVAWAVGKAGHHLPMFRWRPWMTWGLGVVVIGFLVVRNLPFGPFPYLGATAGSG